MLIDNYARKIDYLRISVTDRCNLRCIYCMPACGIVHKRQSEILSFEQIYKITRIAAGLGIEKIRITGGEPLVRKDLPLLIEKLKTIRNLKEITLTTNGVYLSRYASLLKESGLDRINVSLDSLIPEKFEEITRGGSLNAVLEGIASALSAGFSHLKINMVLMRDLNTDEIVNFACLTKTKPIQVRFIEYMPTSGNYFYYHHIFFSASEAKAICSNLGKLYPVDNLQSLTARLFRIEGFCGTVGFISPISEPFCFACNKLRLTADGRLKSCLHGSYTATADLKRAMDKGAEDEDLGKLIKEAVALKPKSHHLLDAPLAVHSEDFSMCQIGG